MIGIKLTSSHQRPERRVYRLAEQLVSVDTPLPEIEAFEIRDPRGTRPAPAVGPDPADGARQIVFRGPAELGRRWRHLECSWGSAGYEVDVEGVGRFGVARDGGWISLADAAQPEDSAGLAETVLGPMMIVALALRGVWCLHASAVELDGEAVAFVGESGAGKSTLARALPELSPAFRCAADDVLPVTLEAGPPRVLPHFPQLKYGPDRQPGPGVPASLPLAAIYLLEPVAAAAEAAVEGLAGYAAALALVRHTVAARLFTADLLRRHVELCAGLASRVPVRRLLYPRRWATLPRIEELLRAPTGVTQPAASRQKVLLADKKWEVFEGTPA